MKVLYIHTFYKLTGGEDLVFKLETELLSGRIEVEKLCFYNTGSLFSVAVKFLLSPWNFIAVNQFRQAIKNKRPDVVHIHNWYFAASPLIIREAEKEGIPVVVTLHNYRLLCPSATLFSDGEIYTESLRAGFPWDAVFKKVYRNSFIQTFWLAFAVYLHKIRGTWKKVSKYIALTDFAKDLFLNSDLGLYPDQVTVKPNFVKDQGFVTSNRSNHFLFVGRLAEEKGIRLLLDAFKGTDHRLLIAGDGPLKKLVENVVSESPNINYLGNQSGAAIIEAMKDSTALVFPSIWYEGMPMTILEAFSSGTPVLASNLGAMKSLVEDSVNGFLFDAEVQQLRKAADTWSKLDTATKESFSIRARKTFETYYTARNNAAMLLGIYKSVSN